MFNHVPKHWHKPKRQRRHLPAAVAIATCVLLLSACANQQAESPTLAPSPAQTSSGGPSDTAVEQTPAPTGIDLDDPRSWIIDFDSIGPLELDGDISATEQSMAAFARTVYDGCPSVLSFDKPGFPSVVIPDMLGTGLVQQIVLQGGVTSAAVSSDSPRTISGIGIGATLDELTAAYPDITFQDDHNTPHYAVQGDSGNWINFSIYEGLVNNIVVRDSPAISKEYCS